MCPQVAWAMPKQLDGNTGGFAEGGEDTVGSAEEVLALSRPGAAIRSNPSRVPSPTRSLPNGPKDQRGAWPAIILRISAASILSGGIAYLATTPEAQPVQVGASTVVRPVAAEFPTRPSEDNAPVRFINPFDATEVFTFPSGTSETQARRAVADLLLQRAHDRQNSWSKATRENKQAGQVVPVTTTNSRARRS
jgi:hypothetical protein